MRRSESISVSLPRAISCAVEDVAPLIPSPSAYAASVIASADSVTPSARATATASSIASLISSRARISCTIGPYCARVSAEIAL